MSIVCLSYVILKERHQRVVHETRSLHCVDCLVVRVQRESNQPRKSCVGCSIIPDRGDSAVAVDAEENRASDVSVPDQNLLDAPTIDMAVCQPRDCGMRPDGVVDMCTNQSLKSDLLSARTPNGDCGSPSMPPTLFRQGLPQPCEPLEDFDAGWLQHMSMPCNW